MTKYKKGIRFITYLPSKHSIGGIGHCFIDYLSAFIISEIFKEVIFVNNKFEVCQNNKRGMIVKNRTFDWFNFLNLHVLSKTYVKNISKKHEFIPVKKTSGVKKNRYQNICLEDIKQNLKIDKLNYLIQNNRIYLFDLYYYEKNNFLPENTTLNIVNKLKHNFYLKHKRIDKSSKMYINVYLRRGDFDKKSFEETFTFDTLNMIYSNIRKKKKCIINIISAGVEEDMNIIRRKYQKFKPNFFFNKNEKDVFYLMTQSDILIFYNSTFPFTASLFCNGKIIKKKDDDYFSKMVYNKDISFLDNYIITNKFSKEHLIKIGLTEKH